MDKVQVLERMDPILNTHLREIDHTPRTRVAVTPEVVTFRPGGGQRTLEMTEEGVQSLANFVGLPWSIAAKLHPNTFGAAATELLDRKSKYSLVVKDQRVNAVVKRTHYHPINVERALGAIEQAIPGIVFHRILLINNEVASIEVIGDKREAVAQGDLIQAGANIIISPMGTVNPVIQSYALRLSCTNGQTSNTVLREYRWGGGGGGGGDSGGNTGGENVWQWFRRGTREAYNALDRIVQRYRELSDEAIPQGDRAAMLEALLRDARIPTEVANVIRSRAVDNPPQNSYDLMNLLTFAASHLLKEPKQIIKTRKVIDSYVIEESHARVCPICRTRRN